jgi:2-phospho-L-lactate guanylyltransferase (CobY/MobA/RfbA family)
MMCAKGARLWAVIPFEHFWFSSRKLSSLLEHPRRRGAERELLERALAQVLRAISASGIVVHSIVVSSNREARQLAERLGAEVVDAVEATTLAKAVDAGMAIALQRGAGAVVALMPHLVRISSEDVAAIAETLELYDAVISPIIPDDSTNVYHETNVLGFNRSEGLSTRFGESDNYGWHLVRLREFGLRVHVLKRPGLTFGARRVEDLEPRDVD